MTNDCERVRADLSAYLDEACDASERAFVESHLSVCAACREELNILKAEAAWVSQSADPIPEALHASIMARVAVEYPKRKRLRFPVRVLSAAVAACAVIAVGIGVYLRTRPEQGETPLRRMSAESVAGVSFMNDIGTLDQSFALSPLSEGVWLAAQAEHDADAAINLRLEGNVARWIEAGNEKLGSVSYGADGMPTRLIFAEGAYGITYDEQGGMTVFAEG